LKGRKARRNLEVGEQLIYLSLQPLSASVVIIIIIVTMVKVNVDEGELE